MRQCPVFGAAIRLARDYWNKLFHEREEAEKAEKQSRLLERKKADILFKLTPNEEPKLIDEGIYGDPPRSADELTWAEGMAEAAQKCRRVTCYTIGHRHIMLRGELRLAARGSGW